LTIFVAVLFLTLAVNSRPSEMTKLTEKHRAIWEFVFEDMKGLQRK